MITTDNFYKSASEANLEACSTITATIGSVRHVKIPRIGQ